LNHQVTFATAGQGTRVIVFLHGIGLGAETFRNQIEACAAAGWRALACNLPGYGGSAPREAYDMAYLADRLAAFLAEEGISRAVVAGHSLGGFVAQEFAARHAPMLRALVLIGTTPAFGSKDGSFEREFVKTRFAPFEAGRGMADIADDVAAGTVGAGAPPPLLRALAETFAAVPEAAYRASVLAMIGFDRRADLAKIAVPTLLVAGETDRNAPVRTMQKMAEAIPGSQLEIFAGIGHSPHLESPERFNAVLKAFLSGLASES
jgi:pimeloyl-ACP methyl ester carboxylesterase